jgi:Galactose oxidase-like, Early set domain
VTDVAKVALIRLGAVTHSFHMDQRYIGLIITATNAGQLTVTLPPHSNIAPPGAYMLFLLDGAGRPSVATLIRIG